MDGNLPWYIVLIISLAAMVIPLISKIIENRNQRRLKTLEVILNHKLDAYGNYIKNATHFAYMSPKDGVDYNEYLKALQVVRLVAGPEVQDALKKVALTANAIRAAEGFQSVSGLETSWKEAIDKVCEAMAKEIEKLTG